MKNKIMKIHILPNTFFIGIFMMILSFLSALIAYYTYNIIVIYFSFIILLCSMVFLFISIALDIRKYSNSRYLPVLVTAFMFLLYFSLRLNLHHFDFFIADASDYYLSGVNMITNSKDIGFFLPLTAAISGMGFEIFGYDYAPFIMVIFYASVIPLSYFIVKALTTSSLISFIITLLIICSPLAIWFPKSTYSESLWQVLLLVLIVLSYHIVTHSKPKVLSLVSLLCLMFIFPFSRGEATLFYAVIIFISFYHIFKFNTLKYPLIISSSLLFLAFGVHLTLQTRSHYLLVWQYHRIISNITEIQLMSILYGVVLAICFFLLLAHRFKITFQKLNIFIPITLLSIISKVSIAYVYMKKSNPLFHNFNFMNEYGFALGNFGLHLTILIFIGILILYYSAFKGNIFSLILIIFYAIFYLPFAMQAVRFEDIHEIFLYWNRYYFSLLMMIHLYALSITLKLIYDFIAKILFKEMYRNLVFTFFIIVLFLSSLNLKLIALTIEESYLENSQKLMPWISEHIGSNPLSIIYDETINYDLHHNRSYDAKILTYRTFPVGRINTKTYLKINSKELNSSIKITQKISKNPYVLCLSIYPCKINPKDALLVDSISLPISWRENYGIHPKNDAQIHYNDITKSVHHSLILRATLYKLKEKFEYGREIFFKTSSSLSSAILNNQWQFPKAGIGALTRDSSTKILIQKIPKKKDVSYKIELKYVIFNASLKAPKILSIHAHNHMIKEVRVASSKVHTISFTLPNTLLSSYFDTVESIIEVKEINKINSSMRYKLYLKSIKITPEINMSTKGKHYLNRSI